MPSPTRGDLHVVSEPFTVAAIHIVYKTRRQKPRATGLATKRITLLHCVSPVRPCCAELVLVEAAALEVEVTVEVLSSPPPSLPYYIDIHSLYWSKIKANHTPAHGQFDPISKGKQEIEKSGTWWSERKKVTFVYWLVA